MVYIVVSSSLSFSHKSNDKTTTRGANTELNYMDSHSKRNSSGFFLELALVDPAVLGSLLVFTNYWLIRLKSHISDERKSQIALMEVYGSW